MNPRFTVLQDVTRRCKYTKPINKSSHKKGADCFASSVFTREIMQKMLSKDVFKNIVGAINGKEKIKPEFADSIAVAMKEWALANGATHYTHWFQPLTGATAEKHDAFIDWQSDEQMIEKFNGKQLLQGEPDASSFPSGGLRSTYEARGYTGWDPTSAAFLWFSGESITLCIPSIFFSWTGAVLDSKIPLLRSDQRINDATLRLLSLTKLPATYINVTLGCEQEYFVVDNAWRNLRPDLLLIGRTLFGAPSPKNQELQDHYFGSIKERIICYMHDFEEEAMKLGIPIKTRHNEVAPAQHEIAPNFEGASAAIDHNILLMELMRQTAKRHDLACLLHEKPFRGLNGSGKHCNWSLSTDTGINLLDPTDSPENSMHFLILITAILTAIHEHASLLRASIGSAANDQRLGGHEAPPAIISVYLGEELEAVLESIETKGFHDRLEKNHHYDLGLTAATNLKKDNTDRNRTSPFAFTGNKFEFRAVGSSSNPSFPITVLNTIVAQSLQTILDEIDQMIKTKQDLVEAVIPVLQKYLRQSKGIRFSGDNYSEKWLELAKQRQLPIITKSIEAFEALKSEKSVQAFEGILTKEELHSRYEILADIYINTLNIEANLMLEMFRTQVLPGALMQQEKLAQSINACQILPGFNKNSSEQIAVLNRLHEAIEKSILQANTLENERIKAMALSDIPAKGKMFCSKVQPLGEQLRNTVDFLETIVDDSLWQLPKYRELLFIV